MFFCKKCAAEKGWPTSSVRSQGPCELCRVVSNCNDVPSYMLPKPKLAKPKPISEGITLKVNLPAADWTPEALRQEITNILINYGWYDIQVEILEK